MHSLLLQFPIGSKIPIFWVPGKSFYSFPAPLPREAGFGPYPGLRPRHEALRAFLIEARDKAGLRQIELAKRLRPSQSYVSYVETGQKLVDVVELMEWAEAIGFDARDAIKRLARVPRK